MFIRRKIKIASLVLAMCMILCVSGFSISGDEKNPVFTPEMMQQITENNQKVAAYMARKEVMRAYSSALLDIDPIEQANGYYCGPACAKMAADYLGLRDDNGRRFTQHSIAPIIGCTTTEGSYSGDIAYGMNELLGTDIYDFTNLNYSDLPSSLIYSVDNDYPMFINVKELPNYGNDPISGGHFILGVGYEFYTQGGNTLVSDITYNDPRPGYANQYTITFDEMIDACDSYSGNFVRALP